MYTADNVFLTYDTAACFCSVFVTFVPDYVHYTFVECPFKMYLSRPLYELS